MGSDASARPCLAYSVAEACRVTSLSRSTLYNLSKVGRLPIRKVAGRSLILEADLRRLLHAEPA